MQVVALMIQCTHICTQVSVLSCQVASDLLQAATQLGKPVEKECKVMQGGHGFKHN